MIGGFEPLDLIGAFVAAALTLLVLLYAFGDNPLFRLAIHIFIGVSAGYAAGIAYQSVIKPQLVDQLLGMAGFGAAPSISFLELLFRLLLIGLLLAKVSPRTAAVGNPVMALLVGIGAAAAIGGAIQGTILPFVASVNIFQSEAIRAALSTGGAASFGTVLELVLVDGLIILIGTVSTLVYFHFGARSLPNQIPQRNRYIEWVAKIGQIFIAVTLGAVFAGVYLAALTALIDRLFFLRNLAGAFF